MLRFPGAMQMNGKTETIPMAPDFADWLKETPKRKRTGMVMTVPFAANWTGEIGDAVNAGRVAKVIAKISKHPTSKPATPHMPQPTT